MSEKHLLEIKKYSFNNDLIQEINENHFVKGCWPLVYILSDDQIKHAYIGETTDAISRLSTHLKNTQKRVLTTARLVMSDKFNKSAALDIESNLIKYLAGDGKFKLLNANLGIANHTYYQKKEVYWDIFLTLWEELKSEGIVNSSIESINNSDLFKYSPYKSLTKEQKVGLISIIEALLDDSVSTVMIEGGAGTGKTILAIYLFAILHTDINELDLDEFGEEEDSFLKLVKKLKGKYPAPSAAVVIPMAGFRKTIAKVFSNAKNLKTSMVIGPAEVSKKKYDILLVDEAHRLRKRTNLGAYFGAFDKVNIKLGLPKDEGDEFKWIIKQSNKNIFFYDEDQSIKPSDVDSSNFDKLRRLNKTRVIKLNSQLRSKGGNDYVSYISKLLSNELGISENCFLANDYEFVLFDSLDEMIIQIKEKNEKFGLSRLVAGFSWEWISNKEGTRNLHDIVIGDVKLKWNGTNLDWVNSANAINEVGCIHTTQGYDLNYTGVIFGNEIAYDNTSKKITIKSENYFDKNGKQNVRSSEELQEFILNIYKTLLLRSIKGTYVYVCNPELREYFKKHILVWSSEKIIKSESIQSSKSAVISPYTQEMVRVPLVGSAPCGNPLLGEQNIEEYIQVEKSKIKSGFQYFILIAEGDSMNLAGISDGDLLLCRQQLKAETGDKVVALLGGENVTIKYYDKKDGRRILLPKSSNKKHMPIVPEEGDSVQGVVQEVLSEKD